MSRTQADAQRDLGLDFEKPPAAVRRPEHDSDWADLKQRFAVRQDTTYLNHGSFGVSPEPVRQARRRWIDALDCQPMDFYVRRFEGELGEARRQLAEFVDTSAGNLVFVENATFGMNVIADSFPLRAGDQVLLNDHEYGAVHRIWNRVCQRRGATLVSAQLPDQFTSHQQILDSLISNVTPATRLIIVSHITSPTALIMPVQELCRWAREEGIATCVDGPHAIAQLPLSIDRLDCDFYTASCHKWLSAPLGSGFLYANPRQQEHVGPQLKSWGRLLPNLPKRWDEEFIWSGTRDPSGYLSVTAAIEFLKGVGLEDFRARAHFLARTAQEKLSSLTGQPPIGGEFDLWYGAMAHVPLPTGDWSTLQKRLWDQDRIEVPIIDFNGRWFVRVSCHLYTDLGQLELLENALRRNICR